MNDRRILVVEDEPRVADLIARGLRAENYEVDLAADGEQALAMAAGAGYAAVLLDLMLPALDGREVCAALRRAGDTTPVLMLTAMDALEDKVVGLKLGADDYMTKPFSFDELLARLEALIRRSRMPGGAGPARVLRVADIVLDLDALSVTRGGRRVELTGKELALLEMLMAAAGRMLTREQILARVWGLTEDPLTNVVDVYIRRLRRKLEEETGAAPVIFTVRGHGYRLDAGLAPPRAPW